MDYRINDKWHRIECNIHENCKNAQQKSSHVEVT